MTLVGYMPELSQHVAYDTRYTNRVHAIIHVSEIGPSAWCTNCSKRNSHQRIREPEHMTIVSWRHTTQDAKHPIRARHVHNAAANHNLIVDYSTADVPSMNGYTIVAGLR